MTEPAESYVSPAPTGGGRWKLLLLVLLGLALHAPMARSGFFADDYGLLGLLREESPYERSKPWNLYDFGTLADWTPHPEAASAFPWWTDEGFRIRFFRPLASSLLAVDRAVFGEEPLGFHFTSLVLYALLLVLLHALYRALGLTPRAARLGLLVFLLGAATVYPVGWISNRNSLLVVLFGVGAALVLARARGVPGAGRLAAAALLALLAALSKESGAFVFLILGVQVALRAREDPSDGSDGRRGRLAALALGSLGVLWLVGLAAAGYGTDNLFYATPWTAPLRFAERELVLATAGALALIVPIPLDVVSVFPAATYPAVLLALVLGVPLARWIARRLRGRPGVPFLFAWSVLLLLPQAGAPVSVRTLFAATAGSAGLLGILFDALRDERRSGLLSGRGRLLGGTLLFLATVGSGLSLLGNERMNADLAVDMRAKALASEMGSPADGPRHAYLLQTEHGLQGLSLGATRIFETRDYRLCVHVMQSWRRGLLFERTGENVFELESLDDPFLTRMFETVYRVDEEPPSADPAAPTVWRRAFHTVEAVAVDGAGLRRIRVTLTTSLDDPSIRFLVPRDGALRRIAPPAVGESLRLPAPVPDNPWIP